MCAKKSNARIAIGTQSLAFDRRFPCRYSKAARARLLAVELVAAICPFHHRPRCAPTIADAAYISGRTKIYEPSTNPARIVSGIISVKIIIIIALSPSYYREPSNAHREKQTRLVSEHYGLNARILASGKLIGQLSVCSSYRNFLG